MNIARETGEHRPTPRGDFDESNSRHKIMEALLNTPVPGTVVIPPNTLQPGRSIIIRAWGVIRTAMLATMLQAPASFPPPAEMARILAEKETPINFTHIHEAPLPAEPRVVMLYTSPFRFEPHPPILRLDGTSRDSRVMTYGVTHWGHNRR